MDFLLALLAIALPLSLGFNVYLLRTSKKPKPKHDITAADLLHDLTRRGHAVLRVEVIDPSNLLLRSPRL